MNPEMHIPCSICGAMALVGSQRCRYCGEVFVGSSETDEQVDEAQPRILAIKDHALLVSICTAALPLQAWLSGFTPPYDVPLEAIALGPAAIGAVLLGVVVGWLWSPRNTWLLAPVMAGLFNGFTFLLMSSWRAQELPIDWDLLPLGCSVGLMAALGACLGRVIAWFMRFSVVEQDEATATPAG